ncbi:hypothetical protein GTA08_BOTSDO03565 [Neofusicoccum parvum]|uniref:Uncharacterized protein n=1 Tax=Neofusicoccum parvum TaxID=310453 RepID=A0ACB5RU43_9PEZI|nr:hypothetical protein GTA08_BOTSDO03565 [Neofusicoccum parvum]
MLAQRSLGASRSYLGVGSEVLILRDVIEPETNQEVEDNDPADDTDAAKRRREIREALEASIAKQQAVSNQEEVNEQINKLRPVSPDGPFYPAFVTRQDSKALRKALKDGYNVAQLRRYASVEEGFQQLRELKREEKAEGGLLWKSAWQEGTSPMEQRLPEAETTVVPVEKLTKVNLVDRIVRDIWDVNVIEDNEALGEIEVKLEPWQLDLLMPDGRLIETSSESKLIIHGLNKDSVELARRILFSVIDIPLFCETKVMTDTEGGKDTVVGPFRLSDQIQRIAEEIATYLNAPVDGPSGPPEGSYPATKNSDMWMCFYPSSRSIYDSNSERYSSLPTERTEHGEEFVKEFVFSAVEHRQMFKYDLSDGKHRVSYTSVEGGRESLQAQAPGLIKTAFNVASLIDDAVHDRLDPPELIIKKVEHHASFKRLTSTGEFEEPLTTNTLKEVEDEGALSNTAQEAGGKKRKGGRAKKRATDQGDENDDLSLREGAN